MVIFEEIIPLAMMFKFISILILSFLLCTGQNLSAQTAKDTILLLNGAVVIGTVIDTTNGITSLKNPKDSTKNIIIENDRIFSITNSNGESIMYVYDTIIGNEFTIDEMRYFILGEQDAERGFKAKGAFWGNALIGAAGGVTGLFLAPIPVFAFVAMSGLPKVKIKASSVTNSEYIKHDSYLMGYERVARKKRKISSLIGGGIGLGVGFGTYFILKETGNEIK